MLNKRRGIYGLKYIIILSIAILVVVAVIVALYLSGNLNAQSSSNGALNINSAQSKSTGVTIKTNATKDPVSMVDYTNFLRDAPQNPFVQALPNNAKILLKFYNFNTGVRQWEKTFIVSKGSVKQGSASDADIFMIMHSRYVSELNNNNFCDIIKKANENRDLDVQFQISEIALAWKYRSVMPYKSCFGL